MKLFYVVNFIVVFAVAITPSIHCAQQNKEQNAPIPDPLKNYKTLKITHALVNQKEGLHELFLDAIETHNNAPCQVNLGDLHYAIFPCKKGHIASLEDLNAKPKWSWKRLRKEKMIPMEYANLLIKDAIKQMKLHECSEVTTNISMPQNAAKRWIALYLENGFHQDGLEYSPKHGHETMYLLKKELNS